MKKNHGQIFKGFVEDAGYELLSKYENSRTKVKIGCPDGHKYEVRPNNFKSGYRCPKCANNNQEQAKEKFIKLLDQEGYELLSEYKTNNIKVKLKCSRGHEYSVTPNNFKSGKRCPKCAGLCPIQAKKDFKELVESEGYELIGEYETARTKMKLVCPEGHIYKTKPNNFKNGRRCPKCSHLISKLEIEVQGYVRSLDIDFIENDRTTILNQETGKYLELDLWFPDKKKAIEFNGIYWHSLDDVIKRDQYKKEYCEWKDIDLLIIEEQDWCKNKNVIKREIENFLY